MHDSPDAIRTVALLGHAGSGKTSLVEALLHKGGALHTPGSVERGSTVSDNDPLERKYKRSLSSAITHVDFRDTRIYLLDTPGYPDFSGLAISALAAVETAAIVINAQTGIEMTTRRAMAWAQSRQLCRMIVVNGIDGEKVDLPGLLAEIQEAFGKECLPINLPADHGGKVVDCFFNPAGESDFLSVASAHEALIDQVIEIDPELMELYLEQGEAITPEQLHAPFERALREGHLVPICFTSAATGAGVEELLDVFVRLLPNPTEGNPPLFYRATGQDAEGTEKRKAVRAEPVPDKHVLAHVFKVVIDPYVGKLAVFRIHQGTVTRDSQLYIGEGRQPFKVAHLLLLQGKETQEVPRAGPGDICAVAKVDELGFDAVLHDATEDGDIHLTPLEFPTPIYGLAIEPARRGNEQRLAEVLHKLSAEDPCLRIEHPAGTNETVLFGLGEFHLRCALERLTEQYKLEVATRPPKIAYRETIGARAEGHHRHKKQTGGAGQFGEVMLRIEPLARGAGFDFVDAVKGGAIPGQFIPAVEKGIRQALDSGPLAGFPMQDVRVTVYDGKSHPVDSKEVAFATAGRKAFIDAVLKARPSVLEPIVDIEVTAPGSAMGDIIGDLSTKRGQVHGTRTAAGNTVIVAGQVPLSELNDYQSRLNSITGGHGSYTIQFSHYDNVPPAQQEKMASRHKAQQDTD
ncbi:protein chain elongation factor EF-G, GTP-binding (ribosomal translocase) [Cupriavidus taiwanensis]|uniref:Elongation factor G n=1 Tax=Cupriavidus taiwanensis TaxID=164546 RepID=A0A375E870_9BURK|nr:elongation factor G [Cupriavidus taiwanensis]SOZ66108.1 protein chain elongation factor EF-G, GTP-binding (ribosomal translocase) [Cupriavidus taiwanensis]SOZ67060.1 protein chain elongation factor EF-G, GTP-binding (ribosomal translocase) [Cupriavidus taiwanensis]SOZ70590.1 protein chain elongation factor EF-G, GTP-binding (ribosomal translocase) [Cupriavidus taiwanensis]SPA01978.1 protein chain elongation factor EF-G, GTP-binding (ribosomal translocase) [Cupriavidus taiwanensis]SPA08742.1